MINQTPAQTREILRAVATDPATPTVDVDDASDLLYCFDSSGNFVGTIAIENAGPADAIRWKRDWNSGTTYNEYDQVLDGDWLAISKEDNNVEKPAPVTVGDPELMTLTPGTAPTYSTETQTASVVVFAQRITLSEPIQFNRVGYQLPPGALGLTFQVWSVGSPLSAVTNPQVIIPKFTVTANEIGAWQWISIGGILVPAGETFDLVGILTSTSGAISFTYPWDIARSNASPGPGELNVANNDASAWQIHEQDDNLVDRSADLDNLSAGSDIAIAGQSWQILEINKVGDVYFVTVLPVSAPPTGVQDVKFTYVGALPIDYLEAANHYSTVPAVQGFVANEYDPDDVTLTNAAYGLDLEYQEVQVSEKWDLISTFSNFAGGGGGGTGSPLITRDEGTIIEADTQSMDFTGPGVDVTSVGANAVEVAIPGSGLPDPGDTASLIRSDGAGGSDEVRPGITPVVIPVAGDYVVVWDATDGELKLVDVDAFLAAGPPPSLIDTREKRASTIHMPMPHFGYGVTTSAGFNQAKRQASVWIYSGVLAS